MNLLLLDAGELDPTGRVRLVGRRAEHLRRVLRVTPGRELRAGVARGPLGKATVTAVDERSVTLVARLASTAPPPPPTDLILALPRPPMLRRILQLATAMGVRRLDLVNAWRVEKSFFDSSSLTPEAIERQLRLGAEQGMTTWLPEITVHRRLVPFLERRGERASTRPAFLAEPGADPIEQAWPAGTERITIAVGPEGGWIEREVESFRDVGFRSVSLGPWIVRVEAAVVAALAQATLLRRMRAC